MLKRKPPLATTEELVSGIRALDHDLIKLEHRVSSLEQREYGNEREIEGLREELRNQSAT